MPSAHQTRRGAADDVVHCADIRAIIVLSANERLVVRMRVVGADAAAQRRVARVVDSEKLQSPRRRGSSTFSRPSHLQIVIVAGDVSGGFMPTNCKSSCLASGASFALTQRVEPIDQTLDVAVLGDRINWVMADHKREIRAEKRCKNVDRKFAAHERRLAQLLLEPTPLAIGLVGPPRFGTIGDASASEKPRKYASTCYVYRIAAQNDLKRRLAVL